MSARPKQSGTDTLLSIRHLSVALPEGADRRLALEDVCLDLRRGEVLCVVGESGSGKSMLANAVTGLLPRGVAIQSGEVRFNGVDLVRASDQTLRGLRGRAISMVFQEPLSALNPLIPIGRQIEEVLVIHRVLDGRAKRQARVAHVIDLLERVGLPDPSRLFYAYPSSLSGGQRQRAVIAMALALNPAVLIADEPTTALDVTTQSKILQLIASIQRESEMGVLFITHDFGVVSEIADRVAVMRDGRVVETGQIDAVIRAPEQRYTRELIAAVPHGHLPARLQESQGAPIMEVRALGKRFRARRGQGDRPWRRRAPLIALDRVDLDIFAGETLGIVGESGSGKSTLARALVQLARIDHGRIVYEGRDLAALSERALRPLRRDIQMVFQDPFASLNGRQTIAQILTAGPRANGLDRNAALARAQTLLELVGIGAHALERYPSEFSGGQRQRISIARALGLEPRVLIADEALSGLDVSMQAQVLRLFAEIQRRMKLALVFITHDLRIAAQICDRIAVMQGGRIVELDTTERVFSRPSHPYTQTLLASVPGWRWHSPNAVTTRIVLDDTADTRSVVRA